MRLALCKYCSGKVVWGHDCYANKWIPIDPKTVLESDPICEHRRSVKFNFRRHYRHDCESTYTYTGGGSGFGDSSPPPPPPPPAPPPSTLAAHQILHVTWDAPPEVIKAAYKALCMLHHPDRGGDQETMKMINVAYSELMK